MTLVVVSFFLATKTDEKSILFRNVDILETMIARNICSLHIRKNEAMRNRIQELLLETR